MAKTPEFIADVTARIRSYEVSYDNHMALYRTQQASLERLRETKTKLESNLADLDNLKSNLTTAKIQLTSSLFKGKRRNKFNEKLDAVFSSMKSDKTAYESNKDELVAKIYSLELELSTTQGTIANIQATIQSLSGMLR